MFHLKRQGQALEANPAGKTGLKRQTLARRGCIATSLEVPPGRLPEFTCVSWALRAPGELKPLLGGHDVRLDTSRGRPSLLRREMFVRSEAPKIGKALWKGEGDEGSSGGGVLLLASEASELAILLTGSGPHFCPGGNPNASPRPGETAFQRPPYSIFLAILRLKEFSPISVALQGLILGGGLAMAMLADIRVLDIAATVSLGNLSRGMVPCMLLSWLLPASIGLAEAMELYLTDDVISAAIWQQRSGDSLVPDPKDAKGEAFEALRRACPRIPSFRTDVIRFAREAAALQLGLRETEGLA